MNSLVFRLIALILVWGAFATASIAVIGNAGLNWLDESTMLDALGIFTMGAVAATFAVLRYRMA